MPATLFPSNLSLLIIRWVTLGHRGHRLIDESFFIYSSSKVLTYTSALPCSLGLDLITLHYIATRLASFLIPHGIYPPFYQLAFDLLHLHFPLFLIHRVGSALQLIVSGRKGFRVAIILFLLFYRGPSLWFPMFSRSFTMYNVQDQL